MVTGGGQRRHAAMSEWAEDEGIFVPPQELYEFADLSIQEAVGDHQVQPRLFLSILPYCS
jgi:hypothetical protein